MIKKKVAEINSLVGGLDTFISATEIDDSSTPDCENVIPYGKGAIRTRLGTTIHGGEITEDYSGQGHFIYIESDNTVEELVIVNGVLKRKNGNSWDTISGGTFSTTARVVGAQIGSRLYFADGVTSLCYYDGTEISTDGINSAPLPSFLIVYNRRLYCNDVDHPDRYYFGGAIVADTGSAENTGDFRSTSPAYGGYAGFGQGKIINGLAKLGNYLIIGLKNEIHRISPTADSGTSTALTHTEELIPSSIGFANHNAIDNVENDLAFLSWSDIYLLGEVASYTSIRTRVISTKVKSIIKSISAENISKTAMIYSPTYQKIYLAYADGASYNNKILEYDIFYKSWWRHSNICAAAFIEYVDSSNQCYLLYISDNPSNSYCYQMNNTANDAGASISWYWKSKVFDLNGFDILKKFKRWVILFGPIYGTITITIYISGTGNTSEVQLGSVGGSAGFGCVPYGTIPYGWASNDYTLETVANDWRWKKIVRPNEGTNIQFKFSGSGVGEAGQIEKIKIYYNENPLKKDRNRRIA